MESKLLTQHLHQLPNIPKSTQKVKPKQVTPFKELLNDRLNQESQLKVSKHAEKRLQERDIHIDNNKWSIIQERIVEAKQKGVNDSLVIINDAALVVSAKNNTVITALDRNEAKSQIFTNINGTILID